MGGSGGPSGGWVFNWFLVDVLLQRGLLNTGCSLGDGVCGLLGVLLDAKAVEQGVLFWRGVPLSTEGIGRARAGRME